MGINGYNSRIVMEKLKEDKAFPEPTITCIGIGGGGCNIVSRLNRSNQSLRMFCLNTDQISNAKRSDIIPVNVGECYIGENRDSGGYVSIARKAFKEDSPVISVKVLKDAELVILISTLGGGTGSGGTIQMVKLLKMEEIPFYVFVVRPFEFEDGRKEISDITLEELRRETRNIMVYDNNEFGSIREINQKIKEDVDSFVEKKLAVFKGIYANGFEQVLAEILDEKMFAIDLDVNVGENGETGLIGIK